MAEDFFTTYNMVEPPLIFKDHPELITIDTYKNNPFSTELNNFNFSSFDLSYPGLESPFTLLDIQKQNFNFNFTFNNIFNTKSEEPKREFKGLKNFEKAFEEAAKINPEVRKYKEFLVRTAKRESKFNSYILNITGAPYYGYFLMGRREIKATTGLSVEQFRNDPVLLILGAVKLYKMNLKTIKAIGVYKLGKEKGYTDDALVAGAWMGGPGGVKKYLKGLGDPSDAHWYKKAGKKGGSTVGAIMNNWMKHG